MASSSSCREWAYDVFMSFRGEDIRKTFMDHLFNDLKRREIHAYGYNDGLNRREDASFEHYKAIEQSRVMIVIFSHNYASSTLCLKELVKIIECNDRYQVFWPIFYDVKPSVVRGQTDSYKEAIMKHEASNETEVFKWKKVLTFAGNISGWDLQNMTNGNESKFIDIISKEISYKLIDGPIHVGENLVGVLSRAKKMELLRFVESNKVHMIGICGIGGIGKTTIAKAIYNLMYKHFEACSFCEDVKETVIQNGLVHLQTKLLDDIIKDGEYKIRSVGEGVSVMKKMMKGKKVFIVLDDMDHENQFEALAGTPDWFSGGSMIVVTSRDRQLLRAYHIEEIYEIDLLNDDESLELFGMYAFKNKHPQDEFTELTKTILEYVKGFPLALKTFGYILFNKTLNEWRHEVDKLQSSPHVLIQKALRVSYDGLDAFQKNIFLDIACFFRGEKKGYVVEIMDGDELFLATNLKVLVDKSLITICEEDRIQMHNLVKEMGWQIIHEESEEPGKRSRLWCPTDVLDVLINDKGSELVKGLTLDLSCSEVNICGQSFTKLKNLRLLHIYIGPMSKFKDTNVIKCNVRTTSGKLEYLSSELQLLCWHGYPFHHLPSFFYPESLYVLDLSYSCVKQIWSGSKGFRNLKLLKLSHCHNLRKTPDFTQSPNLKELILDGCANLVGIHPSIETLKMLVLLNLKNCKNLKIFPTITVLESLKHLILSGCSKMLVPSSLFSVSSFVRKIFRPMALVLPSLPGANLSDLETLSSLQELDLSGNDFISIDANLCRLSQLLCLRLIGCKKLQVLPKLPSSILYLDVQHCISLVELPNLSPMCNGGSYVFDFKNCPKVVEKQTIESMLMVLLPQGRIDIFEEVNIFLPGSRIPGWFSNQSIGDCIKVDLPCHWCYEKLKGVATCAVITPENPMSTSTYFEILCSVKNLHGDLIGKVSLLATADPNIESDQIWLWYRKSDPGWKTVKNQITISFKCVGINCKVKQCGVRLVCEEDEQKAAAAIEDETQRKKFRIL